MALLAHWWERRFDVVNRGFSGYNTRWLLPLVDKLFTPDEEAETKLVTIFLGANDCVLPGHAQHGQLHGPCFDSWRSQRVVLLAEVLLYVPVRS